MRIIIDADGCPVVKIAVSEAKSKNIPCVIVCDTSHIIERDGAETITVSKGADSADFKIANMLNRDDIVITQDYGLAAMCLSRCAYVINQDGFEYTLSNIDALLMERHTSKKLRNAGVRFKNIPKRTKAQDESFKNRLHDIIINTKGGI